MRLLLNPIGKIKMMTLEQVQQSLKPMNLRAVSHDTGIKYSILWRTVNQKTRVAYEVVKKLSDYLEQL
jgi:DNA-directed RNA polymerase specialized sigma54-like protein